MKKIIRLMVIFFVFTPNTFASTEPWYFLFGLGGAKSYYPSDLQNAFDTSSKNPDATTATVAIDGLGFYFPADGRNLIYGISVSGAAQRLNYQSHFIQFNQYLAGISALEFYGKEIGDGLYIRADAGTAYGVAQSDVLGTIGSNYGVGVLIGSGYALPIDNESRVLINLSYSFRYFDDQAYSTIAFSVGGLW